MRLRLGFAALAVGVLAGCGDPVLWERWQAERAFEHARRLADRVLVRPSLARETQWDEAAAAFRAVRERWPSATWIERERTGREIAAVSGRASLALARLEALRGREDRSLEAWRAAVEATAPMPALAADAVQGEARALARAGRYDESLAALLRLAEEVPPRDPDSGWLTGVLEAPLRAARELRARGREPEADALLRRSESRLAGYLAEARGSSRGVLLDAVAEYAAGRRDPGTSLAAMRARLEGEADRDVIRRTVLGMATRALGLGEPDTAIAYARWSEQLGGRPAAAAMLIRARAWDALGVADSALDAYAAVSERPRDPDQLQPAARYERGELMLKLGRWETARAEWRALQAQSPTHRLAFLSMRRIVQHHMAAGEPDLARFEARRATAQLGRLLEINADPIVQREARLVRGELMAEVGEVEPAVEAFVDLWQHFPGDSVAEAAALRAVRLARGQASLAARAESLRSQLAARAAHADVRRAAAEDR